MVDESKKRKSRWLWPLGVTLTGLTGAAVVLLRGCWHSKMSWPVRAHGYTYQVCMGCGIKRLFDEKAFCAYGPYRYDEADYMYAVSQGLAANYTDSPTMPLVEFLKTGLSHGKGAGQHITGAHENIAHAP